jgi:hypothetical protein
VSTKQPTSLVKFTDGETAIRILSDAKLRWSAPCLLNDPFELSHHSILNFDSKGLLVACVKATLGLIFSRDEPLGNSPLIKAVRRWRAEERFDSEDEATEVLKELLASMVQHRDPDLLEIMRDWKSYSRGLRILSLSDCHENLTLWESHGDRHCGVAIRFACGEDFSLEKPLAINYSDHRPEISSLSDQIGIIMEQQKVRFQDYFPDKFLYKSKLLSREKEWRLLKSVDTDQQDESLWFEDIGFASAEVRAVYLGAGIDKIRKQKVVALLQSQYPKARQFQAVAIQNKFELNFERLNP